MTATLKMDALQKMIKALKAKPLVARVGILGNGNARSGSEGNAEVGATHEFGTTKVPTRSFLRVPITENIGRYLENSGEFTPDVLAEVVRQGSMKPWVEVVGQTGKAIVDEAFDTGGFGKWPADEKKSGQILVRSGRLRGSISFDVKED